MKYLIILALSFVTAFACLCATNLQLSFQQIQQSIQTRLSQATNEIDSNLIPAINKNTNDIEEQNKILEKIIIGLQEQAMQKYEILFLLKQHNELIK